MLAIFRLFQNLIRGVFYGTFHVSLQHRIFSSTLALRTYRKTLLTFLDFEEIGELGERRVVRKWR